MDNKDISIIVCAKNAEENIELVLQSLRNEQPLEIILVDGLSTDNTWKIAEKYCDKIISDEGQGLAVARNLGIDAAKGRFILMLGPDNCLIERENSLHKLKEYLLNSPYIGVGMLTKLKNVFDYNSEAMNLRWKLRIYEGEREVVGTPYLFYSHELKAYKFNGDKNMCFADDTDLGKRIKESGKKIGYSNIYCYELGECTDDEIEKRFTMYGISDYQFYCSNEAFWSEERKLFSRGHAWRVEYEQVMDKIIDNGLREKFSPFFKNSRNTFKWLENS
jgi:glycosyltransferase involved in cell wall biosynthesis